MTLPPLPSSPPFTGALSFIVCLAAALDYLDDGNAYAALACVNHLPPAARHKPEALAIEVSSYLMLGHITAAHAIAQEAALAFDRQTAALSATAGKTLAPETLRELANASHIITGMINMIAETLSETQLETGNETGNASGHRIGNLIESDITSEMVAEAPPQAERVRWVS
jgi:hypothetical protein